MAGKTNQTKHTRLLAAEQLLTGINTELTTFVFINL